MNPEKEIKQKTVLGTKQKTAIFIAFLAFLVVFSGFFIFKGAGQGRFTVEKSEEKVDMVKLEASYKEGFTKILNEYLSSAKLGENGLKEKTDNAEQRLLGLKVPPKYKEAHLNAVLVLVSISDSLAKNASNDVSLELGKLSSLLSGLQ